MWLDCHHYLGLNQNEGLLSSILNQGHIHQPVLEQSGELCHKVLDMQHQATTLPHFKCNTT